MGRPCETRRSVMHGAAGVGSATGMTRPFSLLMGVLIEGSQGSPRRVKIDLARMPQKLRKEQQNSRREGSTSGRVLSCPSCDSRGGVKSEVFQVVITRVRSDGRRCKRRTSSVP